MTDISVWVDEFVYRIFHYIHEEMEKEEAQSDDESCDMKHLHKLALDSFLKVNPGEETKVQAANDDKVSASEDIPEKQKGSILKGRIEFLKGIIMKKHQEKSQRNEELQLNAGQIDEHFDQAAVMKILRMMRKSSYDRRTDLDPAKLQPVGGMLGKLTSHQPTKMPKNRLALGLAPASMKGYNTQQASTHAAPTGSNLEIIAEPRNGGSEDDLSDSETSRGSGDSEEGEECANENERRHFESMMKLDAKNEIRSAQVENHEKVYKAIRSQKEKVKK